MTKASLAKIQRASILRGAEKGNARSVRRRQEEIDRAKAAVALPPVRDFVGELERKMDGEVA